MSTSVKEQMGGIYAAELASQGFLALSVDYRNYGESGGRVRQMEDPEAKAQDLCSAVDWKVGESVDALSEFFRANLA